MTADQPDLYEKTDENRPISNMFEEAKTLIVDPPSGWLYGFPRVWDRGKHPDLREWLVANGYPRSEADKGLPCRFMFSE